jgi:pyruvate ferredoxin oxidoreductase gamma subunit
MLCAYAKLKKERELGNLTEIRWHGRAGQGVVTASELLAETALEEGKYFQSFPEFGAERSGAPIRAYSRFSDVPINLHCAVAEPDVVVIFDPTLIGVVDMGNGLKTGGAVVVNTSMSPDEIKTKLGLNSEIRAYTVDATRIALDNFGRNIPNTPMIGALLRASPIVTKESVVDGLRVRLGARLSSRIVEANVVAFSSAFDSTVEG